MTEEKKEVVEEEEEIKDEESSDYKIENVVATVVVEIT